MIECLGCRFLRAEHADGQTVYCSIGGRSIDITGGPDGALYYVTHPGTIYRLVYTNYTAQQFVVTPTVVRMVETGAAALTIRLAKPPPGNVQVGIARTAGASAINVASGATLTFGPGNWSIPQVVQLHAAADNNSTNDTATVEVSAAGLPSETVTVHALDVAEPFSVGPVTREPGPPPTPVRVGLSGQMGRTYVLEANTNLLMPWTPLSTNTLLGSSTNITDFGSVNLPSRFYRARLWP
jgi:hypothetical protein